MMGTAPEAASVHISGPLREHLCNGSLSSAGSPLAPLAAQPCRDSDADAWPHFSELLTAEVARMHNDSYALRKRPV